MTVDSSTVQLKLIVLGGDNVADHMLPAAYRRRRGFSTDSELLCSMSTVRPWDFAVEFKQACWIANPR